MASLTETIPAKSRPTDPRDPKNDPMRGWDAVTHQLAVVLPTKLNRIKGLRDNMLATIRV